MFTGRVFPLSSSASWTSLAVRLACPVLVLLCTTSIPAQAQKSDPSTSKPRGGRFSGVSHILPAMGQDRPVYVVGNLPDLIEHLQLDPSNAPVIELILGDYRDAFQDEKSAYLLQASRLAPDLGQSDEVEAKQRAAGDELKRIRKDMQRRFRDGEWDGDQSKMKQAIDEASQSLVQQVIELQRAQENAIDYSQMFREYQVLFNQWLIRRSEIRTEFEDQLMAFLDPSQMLNWEKARSRVFVSNELGRGLLSGEKLDLEKILDEVVKSDEEKILAADLIDRWKFESGVLLEMRFSELMNTARRYLISGEKEDSQGWIDAAKQEARVRQVLRDHNLAYVQSVADVLSPGSSLAFREAVYSDVLASLYRNTRIFRSIRGALSQRPVLDDEKLESVELLRSEASEWMLDRAIELERSLLEQDMNSFIIGRRSEGQEFFRLGSIPMADWGNQSAESRQQIRDWDVTMMDRLKEIIGDVRFTRLPAARNAPSGSRGRGSRR